jgi:hypothetical protein
VRPDEPLLAAFTAYFDFGLRRVISVLSYTRGTRIIPQNSLFAYNNFDEVQFY